VQTGLTGKPANRQTEITGKLNMGFETTLFCLNDENE
jgi:hypothetical protein